ncbi:MAG: hypothetical protein JWM96_505 [Alphaproteobacteria bacterium]|nr:hypothetical protein [Alphaproteobacteria bacterium]
MKINVTVDCTPEEARAFMGLPDVAPFQDEMMKIMREKALENMKRMEPEAAMKSWLPLMNQGVNQGMNMGMDFFKSMMTNAAGSAMGGANMGGTKPGRKKSEE